MREVLGPLDGVSRLMALLLYGAGLRRLECCRVRIKDVDVGASQLLIRDGKGHKDRVRAAGLAKHATCHTFRDSFAPMLEDGQDIRAVQELLGHRDVATTMIHTHVLNRDPAGVWSPADRMFLS